MDTTSILEQQKFISEELEKIESRYRREGPSHRNVEYLLRKLNSLENLFQEFQNNHALLVDNLTENDAYLKQDLYGLGKQLYSNVKARLEEDYAKILSETEKAKRPTTPTKPSTLPPVVTTTPKKVAMLPPVATASSTTKPLLPPIANKSPTREENPHPEISSHPTPMLPSNTVAQTLADLLTETRDQNREFTGNTTFNTTPFYAYPNIANHPQPAAFASTGNGYSMHGLPKLPPIQIPMFSGGNKEWRQFIELFKAVIDQNYQIGDIQKLQYLLSYLQGNAKEAVAHLTLSPHNYQSALTILEERFSNQRQAASEYIDTIIDCKPLQYRIASDVINMFNVLRNCLAGLQNMGHDTSQWGPMIVRVIMRKFDPETLRLFEEGLRDNKSFPSIDELCSFLLKRHQLLITLRPQNQLTKGKVHLANSTKPISTNKKCPLCKSDHKLFTCPKFKEQNTQERKSFIDNNQLCNNCLSHKRNIKCNSKIRCYTCNGNHHTLLHLNKHATATHVATEYNSTVILATALINIKKANGQTTTLRALIDSGSQLTFIANKAANKLRLPKQNCLTSVAGIGGIDAGTIHKKMKIQISPIFESDFKITIDAFIIPKLDTVLPEENLKIMTPEWVKKLQLADPNYDHPSKIDVILGADTIEHIMEPQMKKGKPLLAQKTKIGWVLSGRIPLGCHQHRKYTVSNVVTAEFEKSVQKFFDIDVDKDTSDNENDEAEIIYQTSTIRNSDGRYTVSLPFKDKKVPALGDSRNKAMVIYRRLEKHLNKDPALKLEYNKVLQEYLDLGHMKLAVPCTDPDERYVYYLPHHAVIKSNSTTTKVRVVFNASAKTTSGSSLNDHLLTGRQIQDTLANILLRWRMHRFVYVADIEKMFRMIEIHPDFYDYQRILWRPNKNAPIMEYIINVVLFGQKPSNFLAVRTLHQLAEDEKKHFPIAAQRVKRDFYVDNLMTGAETQAEAKQLQEEMLSLLRAGGFNLRQWATNDKELLKNIPAELRDIGSWNIVEDPTINTLGIQWNPDEDNIRFKSINFPQTEQITKRQLLSNIASIYDPLQWLAPMTVTAKILMQKVWQSGIDWKEIPSDNIIKSWRKIESQLSHIENIRIPRWTEYSSEHKIELHGFCDASEAAYAAVVYSKTMDYHGKVTTTLLCAKTRVAPTKTKITLPRLELNGALLLAELMEQTSSALGLLKTSVYCWCDSQIVLAWLQKEPSSLENYVGNRVIKIQKFSNASWVWNYIKSKENPADCASRGVTPRELMDHELWWNGPHWLRVNHISSTISFSGIERRDYSLRFSNFSKLIRVMTYCLRFITKAKGHLTFQEMEKTRITILRKLQQSEFTEEIAEVNGNKPLRKSLRNLNPFIDKHGLLRVGGRLRHADVDEDYKHPILLPKEHHITHLIIRKAHERTMHGTINMVRNYLRMKYWIINDKKSIRYEIHRCLTCFRYNNRPSQQLMGDIPAVRITPTNPFSSCGVDFAGPFWTRASKGRSTVTLKGYICVFVCMVTKALHLELVSDLSTEAFLAAFKRFISRRGMCREIYSDNGTNFKGASSLIDAELQEAIQRCTSQITKITEKDGVSWKFIPVATPHFGGLWEAGVKSAKRHIKCIFDELKIVPTFEEFTTILCQIEACLNSRPLVQLSSDPNDLEALTPAHFLTGRTLHTLPEIDRTEKTLYQRWEQLKQAHQVFWKRWTNEYLHSLQKRTKWDQDSPNIQVGQMVLIRQEDTPPTKWPLARVKEVCPGSDGKVRSVLVQYHGNKTKPIGIVNLCKLPIDIPPEPEPTASTEKKKLPRKRHINSSATTPKPQHIKPKLKTKKPKIAPCTWARSLLNIALLFLSFSAVFTQNVSGKYYQVWKPTGGYYVEKLGSANIVRGNLRMEVDYSIADILDDQRNLALTLNHTSEMCRLTQELASTTHCPNLLHHLQIRYGELASILNEILNIPTKRKPRGMLGKIMTAVFGVNDEVYTDIEVLQRNQQSLLQATTQQNILISTRLETLKSLTAAKFNGFTDKINSVIEVVNSMKRWFAKFDNIKLSVEVISTYLTAVDYYNELERKYAKFSKILHGHGDILDFISWDTVRDTTRSVSMKLGPRYSISSIPLDKINIIRTGKEMVVHGYFYIKESSPYELLQITAIPHKVRPGQFLVPRVNTPMLAVNFNLESYFELDDREFDSCKTEDEIHLCTPKLTKNFNLFPNCLIDAVYDRPNTHQCPSYPVTNNDTVWKQLAAPNSWMFVSNNPITASILCEGERFEVSLKDVGIIHALDGCVISANGISLRPTLSEVRTVVSTLTRSILPVLWNSTQLIDSPKIEISKMSKQIFEAPLSTTELTTLAIEELKHHSRIMSIALYISICIFFIVLLITFCNRKMSRIIMICKPPNNRNEEPSPSEEILLSERFGQIIGRPPAC